MPGATDPRGMEGEPPAVDLTGAVALVTGASRGIGRGIAHELGAAGATVYVTGRSVEGNRTDDLPGTVEETAAVVTDAGGEGIAVQCDHTDPDAVNELVSRIGTEAGRLDCLVNNAWGGYEGYDETFDAPFWEQPVERWDQLFDAGVRPTFVTSRAATPLLFESDDALVVNLSAGDEGKFRGSVPYDVAKEAVDRMTEGMAHELRPHSVAAVALYPGFTRTERVVAAADDVAEAESVRYAGRAVAALADDEEKMDHSGGVFKTGTLARTYGFTDVDGSQPAPFSFDGVHL
jgi:NAD(P)-dependent dehydrogenase (short-subunit alcohol dehydrogenase family)